MPFWSSAFVGHERQRRNSRRLDSEVITFKTASAFLYDVSVAAALWNLGANCGTGFRGRDYLCTVRFLKSVLVLGRVRVCVLYLLRRLKRSAAWLHLLVC